MDKITFHKILNFAVEREKEAVDFYRDLQNSAKFSAHKAMLQELENMEKGHILLLEKIRLRDVPDQGSYVLKDLKIVDYLDEDDDIPPDSYHNILLIAMKREDRANLLYRDLANRFAHEDIELSKLFMRLADEEAGHKLKFETLYDEYVLRDN